MTWHYEINQGATRGQYLTLGKSITYTSMEVDFSWHNLAVNYQCLVDDNISNEGFFYFGSSSVAAGGWSSRTVNGTNINSGGADPVQDTKITVALGRSPVVASGTGSNFVIGNNSGGTYYLQAKLYGIRFYNAGTLVANFDLTNTGTFTDQTGNGNTLTATGGSWVQEGPVVTDVSYTYALRQYIYADRAYTAQTKQAIYSDRSYQNPIKQAFYQDITASFPTKQALYSDRAISYVLKQMIYADRSWNYAMEQDLFSDYVSYSANFPLKQIIYSDRVSPFATKQQIWADRSFEFPTLQQIVEKIETWKDVIHPSTTWEEEINIITIWSDLFKTKGTFN